MKKDGLLWLFFFWLVMAAASGRGSAKRREQSQESKPNKWMNERKEINWLISLIEWFHLLKERKVAQEEQTNNQIKRAKWDWFIVVLPAPPSGPPSSSRCAASQANHPTIISSFELIVGCLGGVDFSSSFFNGQLSSFLLHQTTQLGCCLIGWRKISWIDLLVGYGWGPALSRGRQFSSVCLFNKLHFLLPWATELIN